MRFLLRYWLVLLGLVGVAIAVAILWLFFYALDLNKTVVEKFEGKRWSIPSRVYARPLELFPGKYLNQESFERELQTVGYQISDDGLTSGTYARQGNRVTLTRRAFKYPDGKEPSLSLTLSFENNRVKMLQDAKTGQNYQLQRIEPLLIANIYPRLKEDRELLRLQDLPPVLVQGLQAMEDRKFQKHHGIDFLGILRAAWANLTAGKVVQGGSTLTQQLVKNFYLDSELTLERKFNEAIMAFLLEIQYSKEEILEAYINEIYMGQEGSRSIHGFGQAAWFYFGKPASELTVGESATLIAIVPGPSLYNPRRFHERVQARRDMVVDVLLEDGLITQVQAVQAKYRPLKVVPRSRLSFTQYPAFIDLVKQQLRRDYKEEDLRSDGLRIFTSFDPNVHYNARRSLERQLAQMYVRNNAPLQAGIVVTRRGTGEVMTVIGDVRPGFAGLNRALSIHRPVGSLLKPAIYLTGVEQENYTLTTLVDDDPIRIPQASGQDWQPKNYDGEVHGNVPMLKALAFSYNLSAVNTGLTLGVENVIQTISALGYKGEIPVYPSVMLGTQEMSPFEVTQIYQTLADDGFYTPLRAVREVVDSNGKLLRRYPINTEQRFPAESVALIKFALNYGLYHGTGRSVGERLQNKVLAGKTGTTDDMRDSWFAGFGNDYVGVVWLGNDDNKVTGLTGATGALRIWGEMMQGIALDSVPDALPDTVKLVGVDLESGQLGDDNCEHFAVLPYKDGTLPDEKADCAGSDSTASTVWEDFMGWFQ